MFDSKLKFKGSGQVNISDDVISVIAGTAALKTEGVAGMSGNFAGDIIEMLGKKSLSKGVTISIEDKKVQISLDIIVKIGSKIHEVALAVQKNVKTAVENMTGLSVVSVNINVSDIFFDKNKEEKFE